MSINNSTKAKSNKHSDAEVKELIVRPIKTFVLVEPDEILKGTSEDYKNVVTKWLTNFNGALFGRDDNLLKANTDLGSGDILIGLDRKLGLNLRALNNYLIGKDQSVYRNLDDFKCSHTFVIDNISVTYEDWAEVCLVRYKNNLYHPLHYIYYNLDQFTFGDYVARNIVNYDIPYSNYCINTVTSHNNINATKKINFAYMTSYKEEFNKFKASQVFEPNIGYTNICDLKEPVTVTFTFDIDLYFSHLKYLYKVFQTYSN